MTQAGIFFGFHLSMSVSNVIGSAEVEDGMLLEQSAVPCHEENKGMATSQISFGWWWSR